MSKNSLRRCNRKEISKETGFRRPLNKGDVLEMGRKVYRRRKKSYSAKQTINYVDYQGLSQSSGFSDQSNTPSSVIKKNTAIKRKNTLYFAIALVSLLVVLRAGVLLADHFFGTGEVKVEDAGETPSVQAASGVDPEKVSEAVSPSGKSSFIGDPYSGYGQLVNRSYPIKDAESYHPEDLETVADSSEQMRAEAAQAMNQMIEDFKVQNPTLSIYPQSGYRTYDRQVQLYNNQIEKKGQLLGTIYSAIPGTSEHELGLAMDLSVDGSSLSSVFADTVQGKWFAQHSHEYGYILRFPKNKQSITGITFEPWHFRYVGVKIAEDMAKKGIATLEEYYGLYLKAESIDPYLQYLQ